MKGFDWSEEDHVEFNEEGYLDHGKWTFYKADDGKFEAVMDGLYMHVFPSKDALVARQNDIHVYEYSPEESGGIYGDVYFNDDGDKRIG